jgi:hypothetical protein
MLLPTEIWERGEGAGEGVVTRPEKIRDWSPVEIGGGLMLTDMIGVSRPKLGEARLLPSLGDRIGVGDSRCRDTGRGSGDAAVGGEEMAMGGSTGSPTSLSTGALSLLLATSAEGGGGEGEGVLLEEEVLLPMVWWR